MIIIFCFLILKTLQIIVRQIWRLSDIFKRLFIWSHRGCIRMNFSSSRWRVSVGGRGRKWIGKLESVGRRLKSPRPVLLQRTCSPQPSPTQTQHTLLIPLHLSHPLSLTTHECRLRKVQKYENGSTGYSATHSAAVNSLFSGSDKADAITNLFWGIRHF